MYISIFAYIHIYVYMHLCTYFYVNMYIYIRKFYASILTTFKFIDLLHGTLDINTS